MKLNFILIYFVNFEMVFGWVGKYERSSNCRPKVKYAFYWYNEDDFRLQIWFISSC